MVSWTISLKFMLEKKPLVRKTYFKQQ